MLHQIYFALMR